MRGDGGGGEAAVVGGVAGAQARRLDHVTPLEPPRVVAPPTDHRGRGGNDAPAPGRRPVAEDRAVARGQQGGNEVPFLGEQFRRHRRVHARWMRCSGPRATRARSPPTDPGRQQLRPGHDPACSAAIVANCPGYPLGFRGKSGQFGHPAMVGAPRRAGATPVCINSAPRERGYSPRDGARGSVLHRARRDAHRVRGPRAVGRRWCGRRRGSPISSSTGRARSGSTGSTALGERHTVLSYDERGCGLSDRDVAGLLARHAGRRPRGGHRRGRARALRAARDVAGRAGRDRLRGPARRAGESARSSSRPTRAGGSCATPRRRRASRPS